MIHAEDACMLDLGAVVRKAPWKALRIQEFYTDKKSTVPSRRCVRSRHRGNAWVALLRAGSGKVS